MSLFLTKKKKSLSSNAKVEAPLETFLRVSLSKLICLVHLPFALPGVLTEIQHCIMSSFSETSSLTFMIWSLAGLRIDLLMKPQHSKKS
jgi:hypothetical protein